MSDSDDDTCYSDDECDEGYVCAHEDYDDYDCLCDDDCDGEDCEPCDCGVPVLEGRCVPGNGPEPTPELSEALAAHICAPNDGAAIELRIDDEPMECDEGARGDIRAELWFAAEAGDMVEIGRGFHGGYAERCDDDMCEIASSGEFAIEYNDGEIIVGAYFLVFGDELVEGEFFATFCEMLDADFCG